MNYMNELSYKIVDQQKKKLPNLPAFSDPNVTKIEKDKVTFYFRNVPQIKQNIIQKGFSKIKGKDKSKILAYLLHCDKSNNTSIKEIYDFNVQYSLKKGTYNFLDNAIFIYKGKPMFWIYKNNLITVESLKTENEKYIALFSPESWFNIIENVVTAKLTRSSNEGLAGFFGKYWKYIIVIGIAIIGFMVQQGYINIQ